MNGVWLQLGLVLFLIIVNAAFSGTEMALVTLRQGQLQRLARSSKRGRLLADLAAEPNRYLATIQVGITLAGFLASAAAAVSLAEPLEDPLGFLGGAARPVSIVLVTVALSYLTLVLGELAPKRVAMQRAERWGLAAARPLSLMITVTRPVVWLLSRSTDLAVRLLGGDPSVRAEEVTEEELRSLLAAQADFSPEQRLIIDGAFEIAGRPLTDVLIPRTEVLVLDAETPASRAVRQLVDGGHSRAPVAAGGRLDDVMGIAQLSRLIDGGDRPVAELAADVTVLPETATVLQALRVMQSQRIQMVVVVNEHGGAEGIVTVEDLVEELVGEIWDESDRDVVQVQPRPDGSIVLPGRFPIHDLVDLGIDLPEGDYATVAGIVLDRLGHIPVPGERVEVDGFALTVLAVDRRAITHVRLDRLPEHGGDAVDDAEV